MEVWLDEIKCLRVGHQSRDERVSDLSLSANVLIWFCLESRFMDVILFRKRRNFCHEAGLLVCFAFRKSRFRFRINLFMGVVSQGRLEGLIFTFLFGIHSLESSFMRFVIFSA